MLHLEPVDAHDAAALDGWYDAYVAAERHGREHATPYMLEELRARFTADRRSEHVHLAVGLVDGAAVVAGACVLPLLDNRDQAHVQVHTHPDARRHGHGSAMLAHLEAVAGEHGRSVLIGAVAYPYTAPSDAAGVPDAEFARRHGYTLGLANVQRVLDLPADERSLRSLVTAAEPLHTGYTFRQFVGPVPDDLVDSFARILGTLMTEAPMGEIEHEPEAFDAARIRSDEQVFAASGRTKYTTVALDAAGEVAAYTELVRPAYDPGRAYQWGTLARPHDRGHRLGLATKARNLLWAQHHLGPAVLVTYNAEVNQQMIGVNEQLGFRPVERHGEFQKRLLPAQTLRSRT